MKLTINLATKRYVNLRQLDAVLVSGFLLFGALAFYASLQLGHNASELSRINGQIRELASKVHGAQVTPAQLKAQAASIAFANLVIDKKAVNWLGILDSLEEVVPDGVALNSIAPDKGGVVRIGGVARSFDGVRTLVERMERSKNFSEVYLLNQSETKVGITQTGTTFNISCKIALP